jgi:hypothetical protein
VSGNQANSALALLHQSLPHRFGDRAATAADLELFVDRADVSVGGVVADTKLRCGFLDRVALDEELQDGKREAGENRTGMVGAV